VSDVVDRIARLEDWRSRAELRAGRMLEQMAAAATSIEKAATAIERQGDLFAAHVNADAQERAAAAERRRLRNRLAGALTGALGAVAALAGVLSR